MSSGRKRAAATEVVEFCCDDGSDIDEYASDEDIKEVMFEIREYVEEQITEDVEIKQELPETNTDVYLENAQGQEVVEEDAWKYEEKEVPFAQPVFESPCGVTAPLDQHASEYDYLQLFFNKDFWKLIKTETNRYASQMKAQQARKGQLKPGSLLANWKPITEDELKRFFAIIIHMTLVRKESVDSYWSTKSILHTPFPSQVMTRCRFRAIFSCLHLNDNCRNVDRINQEYDAFFKLRPFINEQCQLWGNFYLPNENLTIHKLDNNPDTNGMHIYLLCDSDSGYVLRVMPHVGKPSGAGQTLMKLIEPYFSKWHTVYMDQDVASPSIVEQLWANGTCAVGAVPLERCGLPSAWLDDSQGEALATFCHRGPVTVCRWHDRTDVCFFTTKHRATNTEIEVNTKSGNLNRCVPDCVLDFKVNHVNVPFYDLSLAKRSMKWWKKMFFHLIARSMVNAYIVYSKNTSSSKRLVDFLASCGEALAEDGCCPEQRKNAPHVNSVSRLTGRHFLDRIPATEKKEKPSRVCKVCADKGKIATGKRGRKETIYYCPDCQIPLCNIPCFKIYHTEKDYAS